MFHREVEKLGLGSFSSFLFFPEDRVRGSLSHYFCTFPISEFLRPKVWNPDQTQSLILVKGTNVDSEVVVLFNFLDNFF